MKTSSNWIIFLVGLFIGLICLVAVIHFTGWSPAQKVSLQGAEVQPIPPGEFNQRLVSYKQVQKNKTTFYPKGKESLSFDGGIIRNTDVLLSLGLNNNSIYGYLQCEQIGLKITMGIDSAGAVKMYAHPVLIDSLRQVKADLYFDINGNLFVYNPKTATGSPFEPNCNPPFMLSQKATKPLKDTDDDGLYEIDLNNPCPPCTPPGN